MEDSLRDLFSSAIQGSASPSNSHHSLLQSLTKGDTGASRRSSQFSAPPPLHMLHQPPPSLTSRSPSVPSVEAPSPARYQLCGEPLLDLC